MLLGYVAICWAIAGVEPTVDVEAVARDALQALPGKNAFVFTELTPEGPKPLYGLNADERLAVGSSFKLFILGTLIDEVNTGHRRMDDTMLLRRDLKGPPHSEMAEWPVGSPVTLHTLALKMISVSDNTATDHLHFLLGRELIERQMETMGHSHPEVNKPLLSTREMAALRDKQTGLLGNKYQRLDEAARRKFLAEHVRGDPDYDKLDFDTGAYSLAEWYASPLDMARAMDWIYRHTQPDLPAHRLRAILAIDPKWTGDAKAWRFIGFKGGSEDQLLAGNWLLQHTNGKWYTLHVFTNNPDGKADMDKTLTAIGKITAALEARLAAVPAKP